MGCSRPDQRFFRPAAVALTFCATSDPASSSSLAVAITDAAFFAPRAILPRTLDAFLRKVVAFLRKVVFLRDVVAFFRDAAFFVVFAAFLAVFFFIMLVNTQTSKASHEESRL
jgi:hypothetical protein